MLRSAQEEHIKKRQGEFGGVVDEAVGSTVSEESTEEIKLFTLGRLIGKAEGLEKEILMGVTEEYAKEEEGLVLQAERRELIDKTGDRSDLGVLTEGELREFRGIINSTMNLPDVNTEEGKKTIRE